MSQIQGVKVLTAAADGNKGLCGLGGPAIPPGIGLGPGPIPGTIPGPGPMNGPGGIGPMPGLILKENGIVQFAHDKGCNSEILFVASLLYEGQFYQDLAPRL